MIVRYEPGRLGLPSGSGYWQLSLRVGCPRA